jgi:uncharacterized protein
MVEAALKGVVREVLADAAKSGLPGAHHFYITFRTQHPGLALPDYLAVQYPAEMTIVLEHQFWDLDVKDDHFSVTLSFKNKSERLVIPFAAITAFADPSVKFGLEFRAAAGEDVAPVAPPAAKHPEAPAAKSPKEGAAVVALDAFRKK